MFNEIIVLTRKDVFLCFIDTLANKLVNKNKNIGHFWILKEILVNWIFEEQILVCSKVLRSKVNFPE